MMVGEPRNRYPARGRNRGPSSGSPHPSSPRPPQASQRNEVHHLAKALKVRNFKLLIAELGEENLAVLLEFSVQRVKELAEGLNFTDELSYHIEQALGLPSGFLDQVNPVLTQEERTRLKTLEQGQHDELQQRDSGVAHQEHPPVLNDETKESNMATAEAAARKGTTAEPNEEALRVIRRENLALLTNRQGAKSQLAKLTGLSAANISHRLHGNKHFDAVTGEQFASVLGLPKNWFDSPKAEGDIPKKVLELLSPDGKPAPAREGGAAKANGAAAKGGAAKTPGKPGRKPGSTAGAARKSPGSVPAGLAPTTGSGLASPSVTAGAAAGAGTVAALPRRPAAAPAAPATPRAAAAAAQGSAAADAIQAVGGNVGPITAALLRTIALKSRDGKFSEDDALKMLTDVAAL